MPAFELRSFFRQGEATWREESYWVGPSFSAARDVALAVMRARLALLGYPARCTGMRISAIGVKGACIDGAPPTVLPTEEACEPWTGLLVRRQAWGGTPPHHMYSMELLRSVPRAWLPGKSLGGALLTPAGGRAWTAWVAAVTQAGISMRVQSGTGPEYPVTGLQQWAWVDADGWGNALDPNMHRHGSTQVLLTLGPDPITGQPAPEIPTGTTLGIHGVAFAGSESARSPDLNGSRVVDAYLPGAVSLSADPPEGGQWVASGTVQVESTVYVPILELQPQGPAERKIGSSPYPHLGSSFPAGYIPAPPTPPASALTPPVRPGANITPTPPTPPYDFVCRTARDIAHVCMAGYSDTPPLHIKPISIYRITNWPKAYYVCCSGTESWTNPATGLPSDILEALGTPFYYGTTLFESMNRVIPQGAVYFCAGHSLGGMAIQNTDNIFTILFRKPLFILTFGSPLVGLPKTYVSAGLAILTKGFLANPSYRRFVAQGDLVPYCTPTSIVVVGAGFESFIRISPAPIPVGLVSSHNAYQYAVDLDRYDVFGNEIDPDSPEEFSTLYLELIYTIDPSPFG